MSARSNAPECRIGSAGRFKKLREGDFGSALFKHRGSVGPQGISTKPSLPSYSLGASTRDQMYKVAGSQQCRWHRRSIATLLVAILCMEQLYLEARALCPEAVILCWSLNIGMLKMSGQTC